MPKDESSWKSKLSPEQYRVLVEKGTEAAFTGKYWNHHDDGMYHCAGCGAALFSSDAKFDSGTGWPSFSDVSKSNAVELKKDVSHGMVRTEAICKKCKGHLGHVFDDGPKSGPNGTGKRYCINSCALEFKAKNALKSLKK